VDEIELLSKEIETLRQQLHKVIELSGNDLLSEEVLKSSQQLDRVLVQYLIRQKKENFLEQPRILPDEVLLG